MQNTETNRIENKEQLNEDFEQEVIAFLNYKEGGIIYVGVRKDGQVVDLKDVDLIENIGSGVLRILDAYDKSCFKFMEHFLRVSFKYRENPFEYGNITPKDGAINGEINDGKKITTNEQKVLDCIIKNPNISQKEISEKTEIPYRTVQRLIASLKSKNIITRIGSNKLGYWNIFNNGQEKM